MGYFVAFVVAVVVILVTNIWRLCWILLWRPYVLTKTFEKQGIKGPPYKFIYGSIKDMKKLGVAASDIVLDTNSNDIIQKVTPYYHKWSSEYGETMLYWYGTEARITITDPELIKQVLSNKFGFYVRPWVRPTIKTLMGQKGLIFVEGHNWVRQRRLLNPAFSIDKLKTMTKKMAECTIAMLEGWKKAYKNKKCMKIEMSQEFIKLTSDIIAHTAFGSSYVQGKEAFNAQKELQQHCVAANLDVFVHGSQYLPTPSNIRIWKLDSLLKRTLKGIIEKRLRSKDSTKTYGDDLLATMIEYSEIADETKFNTPKLRVDEILENCKAFFFAGHETTSGLLTWTVFLLSLHQEWQERLRKEVLKECLMEIPDADMLAKLKLMNMVLLETMRLYGPAIDLIRTPLEDTKLGNLMIPKGTSIQIPIIRIHRNKKYWGDDADEFNPFRFANGVSKAAKHPNAFLGFGMGPRVCIGQNFAMLEAKTVLTLILQRLSLSLSPEYKHTPVNHITLHPHNGLPIIVEPLSL
ncbi:hypothetical protein JCGZ_14126 [Jatropha curcas]|uniref:Cytochrome P450 n=1 Tax=Jatropha curcas TaxID=180498 RepID=A0A067K7W1_JATCU|nr:cytochrome P450 709B3 [Jatropha curcas]KDP28355.1 hypothetical protein JCGZ_14126 [Jatropha curcas]